MDTAGEATVDGDALHRSGRRFLLAALLALLTVLLVVPAMPAFWRGLTNFTAIGSSAGSGFAGIVTVEHCSRDFVVTWVCTGRYQVNDYMARPYPDVDGVTVVNDTRHHAAGTKLGATLPTDSHRGLLWGGVQQLRTVAFWLGVMLVVTAGVLALRRRPRLPVTGGLLAGGVVLLLATNPYW